MGIRGNDIANMTPMVLMLFVLPEGSNCRAWNGKSIFQKKVEVWKSHHIGNWHMVYRETIPIKNQNKTKQNVKEYHYLWHTSLGTLGMVGGGGGDGHPHI